MRGLILSSILILFTLLSLGLVKKPQTKDRTLIIEWKQNIEGDFSFKNDWSYPEGVYMNQWGQLSCDGFCPPETDAMKDSLGRIYDDSLASFYLFVDTSHLAHTFLAQGSMYEWAGADWISFERKEDGSIVGKSSCNAATHKSINIKIKDDQVTAWLDYNSITEQGREIFPLQEGWISIDKKLLRKGVVKARFRFDFENTLETLVPLNCEGLIYSEIR
ncbi:MAG: hypothetical protein Crog4KO_03490 [Crocinitomicaceae bacterium]